MVLLGNKCNVTVFGSPVYEPIPEGRFLRILVLHPGKQQDDIKCDLSIRSQRRSKNTYAAISYVWGDPNDTTDITCNERVVQVTRNLADALRQFRHPRTIRRLWADALCINQKDEAEKSRQVGMMGAIFRNAREVLVWLGEDSGFAEDYFCMIVKTNRYLDEVFRPLEPQHKMPSLHESSLISLDRVSWTRVKVLLDLPWFHRAWTVQECALARKCRMYWGSSNIDVADVFETSFWARLHTELGVLLHGFDLKGCGNLSVRFQSVHCHYGGRLRWQTSRPGLSNEVERYGGLSTLSGVLHVARRFKATDPRDHVFAFLDCPFAKDESGRSVLKVDYSMPMEEIWYQIACTLVQDPREGPYLLSAVKHRSGQVLITPDRPTWVPYWNLEHNHPMIADPSKIFRAGVPLKGLHASTQTRYHARPQADRSLKITGSYIDQIVWKSEPLWESNFQLKHLNNPTEKEADEPAIDKLWEEAKSAAERLKAAYPIDWDSFILTLLMAEVSDPEILELYREHYRNYCALVRSEYSDASLQSSLSEAQVHNAHVVMGDLAVTAQEKALFLTRGGRLGVASGNLIMPGDMCCIFAGATVPFILTPEVNGRHRLVCESFIQGVMRGQIWGLNVIEPITIE